MKKWLTKDIIGFSLGSFFNDICHEMTTAILPSFISQLVGITYAPTALGIIQGFSEVAATIMRLLSGWLADKIPYYKPYLLAGYGLTSVVAFIGTATSLWTVLLYKMIAWMSRGIREPLRDTWISEIVDPRYYGRVFGFHRACDTLGGLLGPICALLLLKAHFSLPSIFYIAFIPGVLSILPILFLTHENKEISQKDHFPNILEQIKKFPYCFNYFLFTMFLFGIANFNQGLLIYRVQEIFSTANPSSSYAITKGIGFYSFFNVIRSISEFSLGFLSDYINRKNLLAIFGFGAFTITCIAFSFNILQFWFWIISFGFAGLSAGTIKSLSKAHAATLLPEEVRGIGFGILQTIDGIGDLLSSIIVGSLWSLFSAQIGFSYAMITSFIAMVLLLLQKK